MTAAFGCLIAAVLAQLFVCHKGPFGILFKGMSLRCVQTFEVMCRIKAVCIVCIMS